MLSSAVNHQQWISAKKQKHQEQLRYEQQQKNTNNQLDYLYWQGKQRISAVKHQPKNSNNKKHQQYEKHQKKEKKHQQQIGSPLLAAIYAFYQQINIGTVS